MSLSVKKAARGELVFTGFLFVAAIVILVDTANIAESQVAGVIGPKVFAYVVGALMLVLSTIQLVQVLRGRLGEAEAIEGALPLDKPNWKALLILLAGLAAHILLLELIGFIISGTILFFAAAWALGERRWIRLLLISVAVASVIYFGFTQGLQLDLPWGFDFGGDAKGDQVEEW